MRIILVWGRKTRHVWNARLDVAQPYVGRLKELCMVVVIGTPCEPRDLRHMRPGKVCKVCSTSMYNVHFNNRRSSRRERKKERKTRSSAVGYIASLIKDT
jgi:hypothetical protein